jgi:hypothetical protein
MPEATVNVIRGRSDNVVPNVEEMRRKLAEDAKACGRVIKTVSTLGSNKAGPNPTPIHANGNVSNALRTPLQSKGPTTVQNTLTYPIHGGKNIST